MSPHGAILVLGACLGALAGCATPLSGPRAPLPVYSWPRGGLDPLGPQRVAVLPFLDETGYPAEVEGLREAVLTSLTAAGRFEVVALEAEDLDHGYEGPLRTGKVAADLLVELVEKHGADAVLFGTVTHLRPYGDFLVGLHLEMLSTATGETLWSARGILDAADDNTVRHLDLYHEQRVAASPGAEDVESMRRSLRRFFAFTADVFVNTL